MYAIRSYYDLDVLLVRQGDKLSFYNITSPDDITLKSAVEVNAPQAHVTDISLLSGASSLLVANDNGVISQWFEVLHDGKRQFDLIRDFTADESVRDLAPEHNRKGFITLSGDNNIEIFYSTTNARLYNEKLGQGKLDGIALSPRNSALLTEQGNQFQVYAVHNEHPEVSWKSLWTKIS